MPDEPFTLCLRSTRFTCMQASYNVTHRWDAVFDDTPPHTIPVLP